MLMLCHCRFHFQQYCFLSSVLAEKTLSPRVMISRCTTNSSCSRLGWPGLLFFVWFLCFPSALLIISHPWKRTLPVQSSCRTSVVYLYYCLDGQMDGWIFFIVNIATHLIIIPKQILNPHANEFFSLLRPMSHSFSCGPFVIFMLKDFSFEVYYIRVSFGRMVFLFWDVNVLYYSCLRYCCIMQVWECGPWPLRESFVLNEGEGFSIEFLIPYIILQSYHIQFVPC